MELELRVDFLTGVLMFEDVDVLRWVGIIFFVVDCSFCKPVMLGLAILLPKLFLGVALLVSLRSSALSLVAPTGLGLIEFILLGTAAKDFLTAGVYLSLVKSLPIFLELLSWVATGYPGTILRSSGVL